MSDRQEKSRLADRRRRSGAGGLITAGVLAGVVSVPALAGPSGERVVHGDARFDRNGNTTTITTSHRAIINYDSFNLTQAELVRFLQPGADSSVLNRILSDLPTTINGSIFANGNVYFVNRAGIYFGPSAVIDVGGIYAAAGNISDQDFLNNVNRFTDLSGSVVNKGQINASREAHLVGRRVANFGQIIAPEGMITMTAGKDVLLGQRGGRVFARITGDESNGGAVGVENHGVIDAGGGQVVAGVGDHFALALYDNSVIHGGRVQVRGGAESTVEVSGVIDATSGDSRGGSIEVIGGRVGLYGATLDASGATGGGTIHVGGNAQGEGRRLNSEVTLIDSGSTLSVDATQSGKGGRAIVWSDGATLFRGHINAKGAGSGGFAEVSSLTYLDFKGSFDLRGAAKNGTILIDPRNIIVTADDMGGAADIGDVDDFVIDPSATSLLHDDLLASWLNGGVMGDVILKANNDITFETGSVVVQNAGQTASLSLFAGRSIIFDAGSTLTLGGGSLFANANAVNEAGIVIAERGAGDGDIVFGLGSDVRVTGAGQSAVFTVVGGVGEAGSIIVDGHVSAETLSLLASDAASSIEINEDGDALTDAFGLGSGVTLLAGDGISLSGTAGVWEFASLDATGSGIEFVGASGVSALTGSLSFEADSVFTDAALFTLTGDTTLLGDLTNATGGVAFGSSLSLEGAIASAGDVTFSGIVTLTGDSSVRLTGAGDIVFNGSVLGSDDERQDLAIDLDGNGGLRFASSIGFPINGQALGDITVDGLASGETAAFDGFVDADSLTVAGGAGTVRLGNGDDDIFRIYGANASGNAVEIDAEMTEFSGRITANEGSVVNSGRMVVTEASTIDVLNGDRIFLGSLELDASAADARLTLNAQNGVDVRVAHLIGQSVTRDASGANNADLIINLAGGDVLLGDVLANGAGNVLRALTISGAGNAGYTGEIYAAREISLEAADHFLAAQDTRFGDEMGVSDVTTLIEFLGGSVHVNANRAFDLNALATNGAISLFGARAGDGATLAIRANGFATLGAGDTIGADGARFASIDLIAGDADILSGLFADTMLIDPLGDELSFGEAGTGLSIDADEIAALNAGSIGVLNLGIADPAAFGSYGGLTGIHGVFTLSGVDVLNVFGATDLTGEMTFEGTGLNLYGALTMQDDSLIAGLPTTELRFFADVTVGLDTALSGGLVSFVNDDPAMPADEVGASILGLAGGGSLTIDTGDEGTVTLFNAGSFADSNLQALTVTADVIEFRGSAYSAGEQLYTADRFAMMGDGAGLDGSEVSFGGAGASSLIFADLGITEGEEPVFDAVIELDPNIAMSVSVSDLFLSEAEIIGVGTGMPGDERSLLVDGTQEVTLERNVGRDDVAARLDTVTLLNVGTASIADVFTLGDQEYGVTSLTLTGAEYNLFGSGSIEFRGGTISLDAVDGEIAIDNPGGEVLFDVASILGNGQSLAVNGSEDGTITFAAGISVDNAAQEYVAGLITFLGDATLTNDTDETAISFVAIDLDLGGTLQIGSTGVGSSILFDASAINLNGHDLTAIAEGEDSSIELSDTFGTGVETVTLHANGDVTTALISGFAAAPDDDEPDAELGLGEEVPVGIALLDIQANSLTIGDTSIADMVVINTFGLNADLDIAVGDDESIIDGALHISNESLANLSPVFEGENTLRIGDDAYAGRIVIGDATVNRDVTFISGQGLVELVDSGLFGTGGLTSIAMTGEEIRLGGAITSDAGMVDMSFTGPVNVTGHADLDSNGGQIAFAGPVNGSENGVGFLDIDSGGGEIDLSLENGPLGATTALERVSIIAGDSLELIGANTTGDQFYMVTPGGELLLVDGASFTGQAGSDILFDGAVIVRGDASASVGANGSIAFTQSINAETDGDGAFSLATGANGSVDLMAVGDNARLDMFDVNAGTITLNEDLSVAGSLSLTADNTGITGDRVLSAQSISLITDIDPTGAPASLTLEDAIETLIQGRLGGQTRLTTFTSSDAGTTTLTGGVFTQGLALFRNGVIVSGDAVVQSFGAGSDAGIRFLSTIDGATAGADSLTLLTNLTQGALVTDPITGALVPNNDVPLIVLSGDIGATTALGTLGLNFGVDVDGNAVDGRGFVPANATIVLGNPEDFLAGGTTSSITLNADNLLMGFREKMAVLGSLNASGINARLGDIAAVEDLIVNYNGVTILLRESGNVFNPLTGEVIADNGVDFVAGGQLVLGNIVALEGTGNNPEFALPGADAAITSTAGAFLFRDLDGSVADLITNGLTFLDVVASGTSNTNVSEVLAGAASQEGQADPVGTDSPLSQGALQTLVDLGIIVKQPGEGEYLIDLPEAIESSGDTTRVSRRRLEPTLVGLLVEDYHAALTEQATEDEEAAPVSRADAVRSILDEAWAAYAGDAPEGFYAFAAESHADAATEIDRLRGVITSARVLGLTDREIAVVKTRLYGMTSPEMGTEIFGQLIDPAPAAVLSVR